ncbi:hypothetical protein RSK20926_02277 [Roseobacter sp. SK209-2-6]|uniref:hypothetical protein n=1 Tax=Roseobacter sp. SK209-2-6 TaxID=388739 RepID=UPI0000F3E3E6|nr:hypothetical protein [Roseobacter sp. SK209-2-6]EBA14458.1 hypothetical protein RSK20926_02277 [Roseobacter sp. SK209-2-6]
MQVIFHCGVHDTEEDRLLTTLQRNEKRFRPVGTVVPDPEKYRGLLREGIAALESNKAEPETAETLWRSILNKKQANRVILSNPHFFGSRRRAVEPNEFYPEAEGRLAALTELFPEDQIQLFIALRNPASLLPVLVQQANPQRQREILAEVDPYELQWSSLLNRLRSIAPQVAITAWCFEDMPLIWGQIIREMSGLGENDRLEGGMDLLATIMTKEGMQRLRHYLGQHPDMDESQRRRVVTAFLDKFARDEEIEEEIDLPGWTDEMVDYLSQQYEEDIRLVEHIPGVTFIAA